MVIADKTRPLPPLALELVPFLLCSITNDEAAKVGKLSFLGKAHSHATGALLRLAEIPASHGFSSD